MTTSHIFYIPLVLLAGLVLGVILGRRSVEMAAEEERRREARREARQKRVEALDAASSDESVASDGKSTPS